ncbi:hypothetical protein N7468_000504 [Penicillium chermesinum]|uniref:Uncharacterized protein n=1 Tax=Penicillium chermesinum TaxID=63820 RepID=A0A9W9PM58_9EURO|nr:uncharacterized protein N7468_000504 [Penicillium chermesinum]KAJ5249053.1 hypothetical protein N7468_000504 [Penicillium chermesinum]
MAGGVSPNLKHHTGYTETYRQSRWLPQPRFPWPDYLDSGEATNGNKANGITSLRLVLNATGDTSLYTPGPTNTLRAWELINLTRVRNLEIGYGGSSVVIQKLTIMAREGAFQSLASFSYGPFPKMDGTDLDLTLSLFLEGIPALKRLSLSGPVHSNGRTFTTILYHHGSALQNLRLDCGRHQPGLSSAEWIRKLGLLSEHCPNIQILSLGIARNQGDSSEVAVYRALSWLRRLKHLRLFLDFSEFHPRRLEASRDGGGVDDDEVSLVRSPFVDLATTRACLINSAIDSRLALSIFNIVGDRTSNLQSLHLSVRGDWIWTERCESNGSGDISIVTFATTRAGPTFQQDQDMKVLLKYVANPWIVTRGYQSSAIAKQDRFLNEDRALELSRGAARLRADFSGREDLKRIWTSVWPSKPEEPGDYRKAWWSYPLAGVDETACHG